jgi:hypothetical protein
MADGRCFLDASQQQFEERAARDPKATDDSGDTLLIYLVRDGDLNGVQEEIDRGKAVARRTGLDL